MCRVLVSKYLALRQVEDRQHAKLPSSAPSPSALLSAPYAEEGREDSLTALDDAFLIDTERILGMVGCEGEGDDGEEEEEEISRRHIQR